MLNLFYEDEEEADRWITFDRFPRTLVRRIVRGPARIWGYQRVFLNLVSGLDRIGVRYRINDYRRLARYPDEVACVIGKTHVLKRIPPGTPIVFGPAVHSHPIDYPTLLSDHNILGVLVPCEWARLMYAQHWPGTAHVWPVGIETDAWMPAPTVAKDIDVLVYDKIRFHPHRDHKEVRDPILRALRGRRLQTTTLTYGRYHEKQLRALLKRIRSMVFLCEHETQGIALLQTLSCDVPVYAWDRGGPWLDPNYYPHRVKFGPVTSVPYWDQRCGMKFRDFADFERGFPDFWSHVGDRKFSPRSYVVENLTLEASAHHYVALVRKLLSAKSRN